MNLNIDYETTRATGRNVVSQAEEFNTLLNQINNINNALKGVWRGDDANTYGTAVEEQAKPMQALQEKMTEIGNFLVKVGDTYEQVMENNKVNY